VSSLDLITSIAVSLPSAVIGGVVGYILSEWSSKRTKHRELERSRRETATALLAEVDRLKERLDESLPRAVTDAPLGPTMPMPSHPVYDELRNQGRIAELGLAVATQVYRTYDTLTELGRAIQYVERLVKDSPPDAYRDEEANFGEAWADVHDLKKELLDGLPVLEADLKGLSGRDTS
jgi:sigma54-dependent transcription regulator